MARWTVRWLLFIALATVAMYSGTNLLIARGSSTELTLAMQPLGGPGTPVCTQAGRALLAASDGALPDATPEQVTAWDRAAAQVVAACESA